MPILISGGFFFFPYLETLRWLRGSDFWKDIDLKIEKTGAITEEDQATCSPSYSVTCHRFVHLPNRNADFQTAHFLPFCFLSKSNPVTFKTCDPKRASH